MFCPYTGAPVEEKFIPGASAWTTVGAFDPAMWQDEMALIRKLRTRNGKTNAVRELRCAYTNKYITIVRKDGLARAEDAFSPVALWSNKWHMLYDISFRAGVAPVFPRDHVITVGELFVPQSDPTDGLGTKGEQAAQVVREILK